MRDVTEAMEIFDQLDDDAQTEALEMLQAILTGSSEQLRAV